MEAGESSCDRCPVGKGTTGSSVAVPTESDRVRALSDLTTGRSSCACGVANVADALRRAVNAVPVQLVRVPDILRVARHGPYVAPATRMVVGTNIPAPRPHPPPHRQPRPDVSPLEVVS